jgi:hypothetical protein
MVVIRLTAVSGSGNLKYMSRLIFAAASLLVSLLLDPSAAAAQQVPGRDLLEFPLGLLAEPPALSSRMTGSLWNPAANIAPAGVRGAIGFAGLTTPQEQGVRLEMIAGEYRVRPSITASLSYAQASVSDILRTESDPQSIGGEIPYGTSLLSLGAAATRRWLTVGAAARYRWASLDNDRSHALSVDAGAIADGIAGTPVRIALSSFLFSPSRSTDAATYSAAADLPVLRRDTTAEVRAGYSVSHTEGRGRDDYGFLTGRYGQFDASAGVDQSRIYGHSTQRLRLGAGLRYASYTIAFGREDGAAGFGASYQFLLTRVIH